MSIESFLFAFDLAGTFVFAITGAMLAIRKKLDLYGIFILAIVTALGGGMLRDTMLGRTPPVALQEFAYVLAAGLGAIIVWFFYGHVERQERLLRILDAIGLGLFTAIGAQVTLSFGASWYAAIGMGIITGTGGGMIRDVLAREVPFVLQREVYAIACLAGAGFYVLWVQVLGQGESSGVLLSAALTIGIRLFAIFHDLHLPQDPPGQKPPLPPKQ
jgi:uncharacterized membrane protein YeiH